MLRMVLMTAAVLVATSPAMAVVDGGDVKIRAEKAGDVIFSHDLHVSDLKLECKDCHARLYLDSKNHKRVRMQEDLERALKKPAEKRRWAMLLDTRKCTSCKACSVACASKNKLPPTTSKARRKYLSSSHA